MRNFSENSLNSDSDAEEAFSAHPPTPEPDSYIGGKTFDMFRTYNSKRSRATTMPVFGNQPKRARQKNTEHGNQDHDFDATLAELKKQTEQETKQLVTHIQKEIKDLEEKINVFIKTEAAKKAKKDDNAYTDTANYKTEIPKDKLEGAKKKLVQAFTELRELEISCQLRSITDQLKATTKALQPENNTSLTSTNQKVLDQCSQQIYQELIKSRDNRRKARNSSPKIKETNLVRRTKDTPRSNSACYSSQNFYERNMSNNRSDPNHVTDQPNQQNTDNNSPK